MQRRETEGAMATLYCDYTKNNRSGKRGDFGGLGRCGGEVNLARWCATKNRKNGARRCALGRAGLASSGSVRLSAKGCPIGAFALGFGPAMSYVAFWQ